MTLFHRKATRSFVAIRVLASLIGAAVSIHAIADNWLIQEIRPSETDPAIARFDEPNYVVFDRELPAEAQLVVFLPGTDGRPAKAAKFLGVVATFGYRVIGLEYNDDPAVVQVCPQSPFASCSGDFRERRIFGNKTTNVVDNSEAESIINRLTKLLEYLQEHDSSHHWDAYLVEGQPNWGRIVVSGLSQGAGMAAYIAKRRAVARVVLFSSPWDFQRSTRKLAPWLIDTSATPPERWFAEYHRRENTAALIAGAYQALRIPKGNIRVFDLDLPRDMKFKSDNPFHGSTIRVPAYAPEWEFLFGHSP